MIRHWGKIIMLAMLALIQMACPKYATKPHEHPTVQSPHEQSGTG